MLQNLNLNKTNRKMKKEQIYELRALFAQIFSDYKNDVSKSCRFTKIEKSVKKGIKICNDDLMKKEPLKIKK